MNTVRAQSSCSVKTGIYFSLTIGAAVVCTQVCAETEVAEGFYLPLSLATLELEHKDPSTAADSPTDTVSKPPSSSPILLKPSDIISPSPDDVSPEELEKSRYLLQDSDSPLINKTLHYFEEAHDWLGHYVDDLGEDLDAYFSTEENFDASKGSRLDILMPFRFHADGQTNFDVRFRAKWELPRLNRRWNLILSSVDENMRGYTSNDDNVAGGQAPRNSASSGSSTQQNNTAIGLRYLIQATAVASSFTDVGLNFRGIEPDPYARIKGTYKWRLDEQWRIKTLQDLFWERIDGVGFKSNVKVDYQLNDIYLLRSDTDGTWWDQEQYYELHQNFIYFHKINVHRALAYHVGWDWDTQDKGFNLTSYHTGVNWRERVYKKWLYMELEPRVDFYQDEHFRKADPSIIFMIEARFYDDSKRAD